MREFESLRPPTYVFIRSMITITAAMDNKTQSSTRTFCEVTDERSKKPGATGRA